MVLQKVTEIEMAPMINGKRALTFGSESLNNCVVLLIVIMVVFVSNFTYKYIEIKGQKLGKKKRESEIKKNFNTVPNSPNY